jgi:hypothetical protein
VYPPKHWIKIDGPLKELLCEGVILRAGFTEMPQTSSIGGSRVEASRRLAQGPVLLGIGNGRHQGDRHCLGDLVLQREDVGEIAVVALGPDVLAGLALDQLSANANAITGFAQAAFEDIEGAIGPSLGIAAGFHPPPHLVSIHPGPLLATYTGMPVRIGLLKWPFAE